LDEYYRKNLGDSKRMEKNWIPIIEKRFEIKIHPCETKEKEKCQKKKNVHSMKSSRAASAGCFVQFSARLRNAFLF